MKRHGPRLHGVHYSIVARLSSSPAAHAEHTGVEGSYSWRMARYELSGKVALVTGGARGIGWATARALVARGASVAIADLDAEAATAAAARIHDSRAVGMAADVTDRGAMQRAVAAAVERFGALDVVVANAGIVSRVATFRAMSSESFERVLEVNLLGVCRTVDAALPEIARRQGHVVVVSSIYAFTNGVGAVPYAMSKAAVEQLGRALRVELVQHGAGASVAYFGFIDTEMVHRAIDQDPLVDRMLASLPRPLHKRLPPQVAGEAIVRGIERRQPRIIRPRRWVAMSLLRGVLGPLGDARMERDEETQATMRELDARAGEDQPTTA
jgi:NAD(P)-dependent dehydrogenase (short-subunit alcohol dehydrogenase family)